jgi:hypothetical protein
MHEIRQVFLVGEGPILEEALVGETDAPLLEEQRVVRFGGHIESLETALLEQCVEQAPVFGLVLSVAADLRRERLVLGECGDSLVLPPPPALRRARPY